MPKVEATLELMHAMYRAQLRHTIEALEEAYKGSPETYQYANMGVSDDGYDYVRSALALCQEMVNLRFDENLKYFQELLDEELSDFSIDGVCQELIALKPPALRLDDDEEE